MTFQAIVHAPTLRSGARLNIADLEQTPTGTPRRLAAGDMMELRFGVCCPDLAQATVVSYVAEPESAVLSCEGLEVTIARPGADEGSDVPGLRSEVWFVT